MKKATKRAQRLKQLKLSAAGQRRDAAAHEMYVARGKKAARTRARNKKLRSETASAADNGPLESKVYRCPVFGCLDVFSSPQGLGSHKFRKHGLKKGEQPVVVLSPHEPVIDKRPFLQETADLNVDEKQIVELKKSMIAAGTLASRTGNGATSATVSIDTTDQGREIVEAVTRRVMAEMAKQDLHLTAHVAPITRQDGIIDTMQALLAGFEQLRDKL